MPPRLRGRRRDRRAEVTSGGEEDRRPVGGGRWWKRTSGRRAEVFGGGKERRARAGGALTRGDGEREMQEGTSGGGGCMRMHCGRPSRGERDKLIRCLGLGLWAVYCFMGLSLP